MQIPLKDKHPLLQLIAFIGLSLAGLIVIMLLGVVIGVIVWGSGFTDSLVSGVQGEDYVTYMKYLQILSHLGMFIVPAFVFGRLAGGKTWKYFTLEKSSGLGLFLISVVLIILSQPLINLLTEWNSGLSLPESMKSTETWMKESEDQATAVTELFMATTTWGGLAVNLFMMAIIPALGEELVFRGILQRMLVKWFRSAWVAILATAVIFSAFHMQFYGFIPRMVLGLILGYAFYATGRLWISILIHFINNGVAVVVYWLCERGVLDIQPDSFGNFNDNPTMLIAAILLFVGSVWMFSASAKKNPHE